MKRLLSLMFGFVILLAIGVPVSAQSSTWEAAYFSNPSLLGPPTLVLTENTPSHEWGAGSPAINIPADNFSARWTTTAYVNAGAYQISVRADDGVRVLVDGVLYIDQFIPSPGNFYQASINLVAGNHTFVVEYFEAGGLAYLAYNFTQVNTNPPPGSGATATVTAFFLNVRSSPNAVAPILARISRGETYGVVGRNAFNTWLQLNVNGIIGWINSSYVTAYNIGGVPITDSSGGSYPTPVPPPPATPSITVNTTLLNVRNTPNPFTGQVLTRISYGQSYQLIGHNADASWLQINANGIIGWVNGSYVIAYGLGSVPVTDPGTNPAPPPTSSAFGTVTAYYLNVRTAPNAYAPRLTVISWGQTYPIVGRTYDSSWVQLNANGVIGWVNRGWLTVSNLAIVPVTG